jgi:hypothetical protein
MYLFKYGQRTFASTVRTALPIRTASQGASFAFIALHFRINH